MTQDKFPTGAETQKNERLINTSETRGIKEEILNMTAKEYLEKHKSEMKPEEITAWENRAKEEEDQERIESESLAELEELKKAQANPPKMQMEELEITPEKLIEDTQKRLQEIVDKDERGINLTTEEQQMLVLYGEIQKSEQELQRRLKSKEFTEAEKQRLDTKLKEIVINEYQKLKETDPGAIMRNEIGPKQEGIIVGRNLIKGLLFIAATHWSMRKGYFCLIKVWKEKGVEILFLNKQPKFVEFWSTNERGEDQISICKVKNVNYRWMGSSIPIAFAVEGFIQAYDYYDNTRDEYNQEIVQKMNLIYYYAGVLKNKETFPDQKDPDMWSKYKLLLIIAAVVVLVIIGLAILQYQQVQDMKAQIEVLNTALGMTKTIMDSNAIIIGGGAI